jgi:hypothetical protein
LLLAPYAVEVAAGGAAVAGVEEGLLAVEGLESVLDPYFGGTSSSTSTSTPPIALMTSLKPSKSTTA